MNIQQTGQFDSSTQSDAAVLIGFGWSNLARVLQKDSLHGVNEAIGNCLNQSQLAAITDSNRTGQELLKGLK